MSVTLQDNADQPILEPALGETPLWNETRITGLFEVDIDIADTQTRAEQALGKPWLMLAGNSLKTKTGNANG